MHYPLTSSPITSLQITYFLKFILQSWFQTTFQNLVHYQQRYLSNICRMPWNVFCSCMSTIGWVGWLQHHLIGKTLKIWHFHPHCMSDLKLGRIHPKDDKVMGERTEQRVEGISESLISPNKHCKAFLKSHLKHIYSKCEILQYDL